MFLASTTDPDIVQLGRLFGFVLFLGVLPSSLILFIVLGIKLILQRTTKRIVLFIASGIVSTVLIIPFILAFRGAPTSRSLQTFKHTKKTDKVQSQLLQKPSETAPKLVFAKAENKIVMIDSFNALCQKTMQGSGVILGASLSTEKQGYFRLINGADILTNYHVVRNAKYVVVTTKEGTSHLGAVIYLNQSIDLALIRVSYLYDSEDTSISTSVCVGDSVYTISNPQGLGWSLSEGLISRMPAKDNNYIQFTAPVSSGSSGGGLFDSQCNLVGIITAILKESQNINFAIYLSSIANDINKLRHRAAFPFSSVEDEDWRAGIFVTDDAERGSGKLYANRINYRDVYYAKRMKLRETLFQIQERQPNDWLSKHTQREKDFFQGNQEMIFAWRNEYPNDPEAILAYIEMMFTLDNEDEAKKALLSALESFPFNIDVIRQCVDTLIELKRYDSAADIITNIQERFRAIPKMNQTFSDDWSNQYFNEKKYARDLDRKQFIDDFNSLVKIYNMRGIMIKPFETE